MYLDMYISCTHYADLTAGRAPEAGTGVASGLYRSLESGVQVFRAFGFSSCGFNSNVQGLREGVSRLQLRFVGQTATEFEDFGVVIVYTQSLKAFATYSSIAERSAFQGDTDDISSHA